MERPVTINNPQLDQERLQASIMRHLAAAWNSIPGTSVTHEEKLQIALSALENLLKAESIEDPWNTLVTAMEHLGKHEPLESIPFTEVKPEFTRRTPTEDHTNLISHYLNMHANGYTASNGTVEKKMSAEEAYPGNELPKFVAPIKFMIEKHQAKSVMDYGSGKGKQYGPATVKGPDGKALTSPDSIHAAWKEFFELLLNCQREIPEGVYEGLPVHPNTDPLVELAPIRQEVVWG
jgi:hypothetical protein